MNFSRLLRTSTRLLLFCALLVVVLPLLAAPGDLDLTWDGDGVITFLPPLIVPPDQYGPPTYFNDVIMQPDGKVIGVGLRLDEMWNYYVSATRFLNDGQIDVTYGTAGIALAEYGTVEQWDSLFHAAQTPDKGILTVGFAPVPTDIHITKFNASGLQDTTFGYNGRVYLSQVFSEYNLDPYPFSGVIPIAVQPDGKFWAASRLNLSDELGDMEFLLRFNPNGQIDTTFANGGILNINNMLTPYFSFNPYQIVLQNNGKILLAGNNCSMGGCGLYGRSATIMRLNSDGSFDTSFGNNGIAKFRPSQLETDIQERFPHATSIAVLPDSKLMVVAEDGRSPNNFVYLARLTADGQLDSTFDGNGLIQTNISNSDGYAKLFESRIQANGKILVGGTQNGLPLMARFNPDGTPDLTWGGSGYVTTPLPSSLSEPARIIEFGNFVLQPDGKIVAVPRMDQSGFAFGSHHIVRFEGDPAFGYAGLTPAHRISDVAISTDLTLTFPDSVTINTGKIEIRRVGDFSLFESMLVTDVARISGDGTNTITINPTSNFEPNTPYFVLVDPNTFTNPAGHPFSGVRELVEWHFTTGDAPPNTAPELVEIGDKAVESGELLSFTATATDIDGHNLIFSLDDGDTGSVPSGAVITASGEFSWTPSEAQVGQHSFDVVVTDDGEPNLSDFETITVTVTAAPVEPPTELLTNRGFENKTPNNPKRATKWTVNKLVTTDGRVCNKTKPPTIYAYAGKCAFQFQSSAAKARYIEQKMPLTEALADQTMRVAGYVKRKGLTAGAAIQVQITYTDNSKETLKIAIPGGTKGYKLFENTLVLQKDAKRARVRITTGKSKGQLLVDSLSLTVGETIAETSPVLLPDAPDLRGN